jgi:general secretion pathway protein G
MDPKQMKQVARAQRGMTLIEIMVVVAILGMIASVVGVAVMGRFAEARRQTSALDIKGFEDGLLLYKMKHGHFPTTSDGLTVLYQESYLKGTVKQDPWGHDYVYVAPGQKHPDSYDITSYAADGQPGGEKGDADITNN